LEQQVHSHGDVHHDDIKHSAGMPNTRVSREHERSTPTRRTHLTAGAREFKGTMAKPAALTAADWRNPPAILVPIGIASMTLGRWNHACEGRGVQAGDAVRGLTGFQDPGQGTTPSQTSWFDLVVGGISG
jgi:hypothetical protein